MPATDSGYDLVRVLGPAEGLWVLVCLSDEAVDGGLECDDRVEHAVFEPAVGQFGEEAIDSIDPRRRGRREVKGEPLVPPKPFDDLGVFVGCIVVKHEV